MFHPSFSASFTCSFSLTAQLLDPPRRPAHYNSDKYQLIHTAKTPVACRDIIHLSPKKNLLTHLPHLLVPLCHLPRLLLPPSAPVTSIYTHHLIYLRTFHSSPQSPSSSSSSSVSFFSWSLPLSGFHTLTPSVCVFFLDLCYLLQLQSPPLFCCRSAGLLAGQFAFSVGETPVSFGQL